MARLPAVTRRSTSKALRTLLERLASESVQPEDCLWCACCDHPITSLQQHISMHGKHLHHLCNPHGLEFDVACFAEAWGALVRGPRADAFTWFPGYTWRLAVCADCGEHLGWYYESEEHAFYGLIADKLRAPSRPL